jgi:hypothetical protein
MTSDSATIGTPAPTPPPFSVRPYAPDGGTTMPGIMMLVGALVVTGAVLGFIAHFIAQAFYLILVFPVLIGLGIGAVGVRMVKAGRVRNPWIGGIAGFLGGALAMFMMHYFDQQKFRDEAIETQPGFAQVLEMSQEERQEFFGELEPHERDGAMRAIRAAESVPGFLELQAHYGVTIGKPGRSGESGINLGYAGSYIYWLIELLVVAGITYAMVRSATREPFCADCEQWKSPKVLGFFGAEPALATAAVQSGDLAKIGRSSPTQEITNVRLTAHACDGCVDKGEADLKLELLTTDKEGKLQSKMLAHMTYPAKALPDLVTIFQPSPPPPAGVEAAPGAQGEDASA